jgi:hypothetical protein
VHDQVIEEQRHSGPQRQTQLQIVEERLGADDAIARRAAA